MGCDFHWYFDSFLENLVMLLCRHWDLDPGAVEMRRNRNETCKISGL